MAVVLMVTGALFTYFGPVKEWGVPTLSAVEPGMRGGIYRISRQFFQFKRPQR